MTQHFHFDVTPQATELRLRTGAGFLLADLWAIEAPVAAIPGVDVMQRLIAAENAIAEADVVLVEHRAIADLSAREADALGLPPVAEAVAEIRTTGIITRPEFRAVLEWKRPNGQRVVGAQRVGAWLQIGGRWHRLPDVLFAIAEAVDALAAVPDDDLAGRLSAIAALRDLLPAAQASGAADAPGLLGTMTIATADAFSLDLKGEGEGALLVPILHRAGTNSNAPLLAADQQAAFGEDQFNRFHTARSVYTLNRGCFLVLSPPLRQALAEVRRVQSAPAATKRALLASPRAFLRQALGEDVDITVVEELFRETKAYSDRVLGLGLWQPRVLPWIALDTTEWFGPEGGPASGGPRRTAAAGLVVGDRRIPLDDTQADDLRARVEAAIAVGAPWVPHEGDGGTVQIPASSETLEALQRLETSRTPCRESAGERPAPEVLVIRPNEEAVDVQASFTPRAAPALGVPQVVTTVLKPHQLEGIEWLQKAWTTGRPGVLLADDMGLGKTLQGLTFLAWLRGGIQAGTVPRGPVLIVAPTGLLENWRSEHDRHLTAPGLGVCTLAYGRGLAALRRATGEDRPALDITAIQAADWVLTTYETLRDYDRDFGQVRFVAMLFDEAQKIKTPGGRITDAAKAMNADFRIALTGTPVENRLADLWCIVDTVHPAYLDDLKSFSNQYERSGDVQALSKLKRILDRPIGGRPPLLLRRLKEDRLPDLPTHNEVLREAPMPPAQLDAYEETIKSVRDGGASGGAVLAALQRLRAVSLHPGEVGNGSDASFIAASARMKVAMEALDEIQRRGERALVFVDDLDLQARMVGMIQRRYRLTVAPMVINGQVAGGARQSKVDRFQQAPDGFDVMILSPRAGGVGLTLTRANHVIHLSRWWNPAVEDQCTGRVVRIGQTRPVTIHIPLAVLPDGRRSFDQNLQALLERKRQLMMEALCPPAATEAEYEYLLSATLA